MDALIKKANFSHDDEDEADRFEEALSDWCSSNEEKCTLADGEKALKALAEALSGKKIPAYEKHGWEQARSTYDTIRRIIRDLKDDGKAKESAVQEAFYNFILQVSSTNFASIQMKIVKECIDDSDANLPEYVKALPIEKVKPLLAICKRQVTKESGVEMEPVYDLYSSCLSTIVRDLLSEQQVEAFKSDFTDIMVHLFLDFTHLDADSLDHMLDLSDRMESALDKPWEKTTDFASVKNYISKLKDQFARSSMPKVMHRPLREFIRQMAKDLGKRGLAEEFSLDFHDLVMAVSRSKIKGEGSEEFLRDCFRSSLAFFRELPDDVIKTKKTPFKELAEKFEAGINEMSMKFLEEDYPVYLTDAMEHMYPKNRQHSEQWLKLMVPLLKKPCEETIRAAQTISESIKGMEWKGKTELAKQVFEAANALKIPDYEEVTDAKKRLGKRESFIKYMKYLLRSFMDGLVRAKLMSTFGAEALYICTKSLQMAEDSEELFNFVEDISERIEIDIKDPRSKKAVMDTLRVILEICQNPEYPWVDNWYFERAVKELGESCCKSVKDPRHLTEEDLKAYVAICEECLKHDVLDPHTGQFSSSHYKVFMIFMENVFTWFKTLDKFELAKDLMEPILATYETEEPMVFTLNSRYLSDLSQASSGMKLLAPHVDRLLALLVETENQDLIRTLYSVYPANPKPIRNHMKPFMAIFENTNDDSTISYLSLILLQATKSVPEVFTKENSKQILDKCAQNPNWQSSMLQVVQELCRRRPELMVTHFDILTDKTKWNGMLKTWMNDMIAALALYDEKLAPKALDYLLEEARTDQDKASIITSLNAARQIGFKYKEPIKDRRAKVEQLTFNDPDGQNMRQTILDMIDGKTSDEVMKQMEEQLANIDGLVGRVDEIEEDVAGVKTELNKQGQEINTVKQDVNEQGQRLDQVEETVEDTVAKVEEIDQKTLSHAPYWSRDVSKLLNPATEHDWRLLSSRLGYSNDDIRGWAQQADPCMAMLNEWYATRKTSEATMAILTQLQEMNRLDVAVIVENAMKNAEAVVEDEEFEYASPPPVFISYQWGHQPEARLLQKHLEMAGYQCWLDLGQMGGGDKLFEKIDSGIRAAKVVISCVTDKYAKSPNCNREVNLSVSLKKAMIPLLMEKCTWPPPGSMGPIFSEYLFIRFYQRAGEELPDERYWPEDKFQELLMQLNVMGLPPDENQIEPVYRDWWMPKVQEIKIDKSKTNDGGSGPKKDTKEEDKKAAESPDVFISYQWGKQKNIIQLYERLTGLGFTCWLDIKQMGGGDSLYDKIDRGLRGCRVVVSCVTQKYSLSPNCRREVSLADALKKPLLPVLLESMSWPPAGPMSMAFTQLLYIDFTKVESEQMTWDGVKTQELLDKINQHVPMIEQPAQNGSADTKTGGHIENIDTPKERYHSESKFLKEIRKNTEDNVLNESERVQNNTEEKKAEQEDKLGQEIVEVMPHKNFDVFADEEYEEGNEIFAEEKDVIDDASKLNDRLKTISERGEESSGRSVTFISTIYDENESRNDDEIETKKYEMYVDEERENITLDVKNKSEEARQKKRVMLDKRSLLKSEAQKEKERKREVEKRRLERRKEYEKQLKERKKKNEINLLNRPTIDSEAAERDYFESSEQDDTDFDSRERFVSKMNGHNKRTVSSNLDYETDRKLAGGPTNSQRRQKESSLLPSQHAAAAKQRQFAPYSTTQTSEPKRKRHEPIESQSNSATSFPNRSNDWSRSSPRTPNGTAEPMETLQRNNGQLHSEQPKDSVKSHRKTFKTLPSQRGKTSKFDPFSSPAYKKEPATKPKQAAPENPKSTQQQQPQKQEPVPETPKQHQQQQQPQQQQQQPEVQKPPVEKPQQNPPAPQPPVDQPPQEKPKKSKTCAIL